jgi:hypothetical protein
MWFHLLDDELLDLLLRISSATGFLLERNLTAVAEQQYLSELLEIKGNGREASSAMGVKTGISSSLKYRRINSYCLLVKFGDMENMNIIFSKVWDDLLIVKLHTVA